MGDVSALHKETERAGAMVLPSPGDPEVRDGVRGQAKVEGYRGGDRGALDRRGVLGETFPEGAVGLSDIELVTEGTVDDVD